MLMICWFNCGPSVKREKGSETEMPGCKMKLELSSKNKSNRKATSTSGTTTSHPKLYSFVRLSFIDLFGDCCHAVALAKAGRSNGRRVPPRSSRAIVES